MRSSCGNCYYLVLYLYQYYQICIYVFYIYSKIKTEYEMNNYILNINYEGRTLLCKMRVSDHFLEIER
jgi:hypothetical protein